MTAPVHNNTAVSSAAEAANNRCLTKGSNVQTLAAKLHDMNLQAPSRPISKVVVAASSAPKVIAPASFAAQIAKQVHAQVVLELGLRFTMNSFEGIAANVSELTQKIQALVLRVDQPLSSDEISSLLNDARSYMQSVENIFKALGVIEDYRTPKVREKVETIQTTLCKVINELVLRTNELMGTEHFQQGIAIVAEYESEKLEVIDTIVDDYVKKASHTLGLVNFQQDMKAADVTISRLDTSCPDQVVDAITKASIAMDRTADALNSFQLASASVKGYKNSLLEKMMRAREQLSSKVGQVLVAKQVQEVRQKAENAVHFQALEDNQKRAEEAASAIEHPSAVELTSEQMAFVAIINNAKNEKVPLSDELKLKLDNLASRMMPLVKIIADCRQQQTAMAQGDICSLAQTMIDYLLFYQHFVAMHVSSLEKSHSEYNEVRTLCKEGLDQFIIYLSDDPFTFFDSVREKAAIFLGPLEEEINSQLEKATAAYEDVVKRSEQG